MALLTLCERRSHLLLRQLGRKGARSSHRSRVFHRPPPLLPGLRPSYQPDLLVLVLASLPLSRRTPLLPPLPLLLLLLLLLLRA